MKKYFFLIILVATFLTCKSCNAKKFFIELDNGNILAPNGTEYVWLFQEPTAYFFGYDTFLGGVEGEDDDLVFMDYGFHAGIYSFEDDPNIRHLRRFTLDCEWYICYRDSSLPELDMSPENCIRLEFVRWQEAVFPDDKHMTCGEGITDPDVILAFFADVRGQLTAKEAGLWESYVPPDGPFKYPHFGTVFGFFKDEPNLAIRLRVNSFNGLAYSIELGDYWDEPIEYVLSEEWLTALQVK